MMQPTGMVPRQGAPMHMDQQQQQQQPQQYQQPLSPQQWMTMMQQPPQQQPFQPRPPPPHGWAQQPPQMGPGAVLPPPTHQMQQPMQPQPQQQYGAMPPNTTNEIRSLWIGDLQYWMDENYLNSCFYHTGELASSKVIRNKQTGQSESYGFLEFRTRAAAEAILQGYNGTLMPNSEQNFRLNWATLGPGERRADDALDYTIFIGDLASDVTDYLLQETFKARYQSVKGAKVVTDTITGRSKGYGFVKFCDESEQLLAMTEMNGVLCSTRPMRIGPAANKKPVTGHQYQRASYEKSQGNPSDSDPNNTTIFVGGLDPSISDEILRQVFGHYGDLVHVKIPVGKRCGFVQFANRASAEQALSSLNGTQLGGQNIRLSWGRNTASKQTQPDQTQWNAAYYGFPQGYEGYGYAPPPQDPNLYYGGYPGYANYQQPQQ